MPTVLPADEVWRYQGKSDLKLHYIALAFAGLALSRALC